MNTKMVALSTVGTIVVLGAALGGGWAMISHQLGDAEAKISKAISFGTNPGKSTPAKLFGDNVLASQNVSSALVVMGARYEYGVGVDEDLAAALANFKKAADQGDPIGELMLGRLYDDDNTSPDQQHVVRKSVTDPRDPTNLVNSREDNYLTNNSGERLLTLDDATALDWYRKAAAKGNAAAMDLLGDYYIKWERTEGNASKGVE
jgi:hypothetical protein